MSAAGKAIIEVARGEIGVREEPFGSNTGPRVNVYKAETWLPANQGWPWCVAFWQFCVHKGLKKKFPYPTAAVEQLEVYCRQYHLDTETPTVGAGACFSGDHITIYDQEGERGYFLGLGGNQSNSVNRKVYQLNSVSTWIDPIKVRKHLGLPPLPVATKPPRYEVVRGEGGQRKTIYLGSNLNKAVGRVEKAMRNGAGVVKLKRKK